MRRDPDRVLACRNCGRPHPADALDQYRWCAACRAVVVRRATVVARLTGALAALGLTAWIVAAIGPGPRFLVGWGVLVVATYFFVFKLMQRVAFEIIRSRGVAAPPEGRDGGA